MKGPRIKQEFSRSIPVLHVLLRYTQALITQMAQTAVCNRHHSLDQQLCHWKTGLIGKRSIFDALSCFELT